MHVPCDENKKKFVGHKIKTKLEDYLGISNEPNIIITQTRVSQINSPTLYDYHVIFRSLFII